MFDVCVRQRGSSLTMENKIAGLDALTSPILSRTTTAALSFLMSSGGILQSALDEIICSATSRSFFEAFNMESWLWLLWTLLFTTTTITDATLTIQETSKTAWMGDCASSLLSILRTSLRTCPYARLDFHFAFLSKDFACWLCRPDILIFLQLEPLHVNKGNDFTRSWWYWWRNSPLWGWNPAGWGAVARSPDWTPCTMLSSHYGRSASCVCVTQTPFSSRHYPSGGPTVKLLSRFASFFLSGWPGL